MKDYQNELFVYKYRPTNLSDIDRTPSKILKNMNEKNILPNMIFYGLPSSGKHTLLYAFLKDKYGKFNISCSKREYKINGKKLIIPVFYSPYHIEVNVNSFFSHTRTILPDLIKSYVTTKNILTQEHKLFVIHHMDDLEVQTQHMLRRILEVYIDKCRFIFITQQLNKITLPLQSRSCIIHIPQFTDKEIYNILQDINATLDEQVDEEDVKDIVELTKPNLKEAIFKLECKYRDIDVDSHYVYKLRKDIKMIMDCKSVTIKLYDDVDNILYEYLYKNIKMETIIYHTFRILCEILDVEETNKILSDIIQYDKNIVCGCRDFIHIQALFYYLIDYFGGTK